MFGCSEVRLQGVLPGAAREIAEMMKEDEEDEEESLRDTGKGPGETSEAEGGGADRKD